MQFVPDSVRDNGGEILFVVEVLAAIVALGSKKLPTGKAVRWLWRRNVSDPLWHRARTVIRDEVTPVVAGAVNGARAAAKEQHDEQNLRFDKIDQGQSDQAAALAGHAERLDRLEEHVVSKLPPPRLPDARERKDDLA